MHSAGQMPLQGFEKSLTDPDKEKIKINRLRSEENDEQLPIVVRRRVYEGSLQVCLGKCPKLSQKIGPQIRQYLGNI